MKTATIIMMFLVFIALTACVAKNTTVTTTTTQQKTQIANPASTYCIDHGGRVDIRTAADGSQSGYCIFASGNECEEWRYFRGDCKDEKPTTNAAGLANPASVYCEKNGGRSEIVTAAEGSQSGNCIFPSGKTCEEWAYYRGECTP